MNKKWDNLFDNDYIKIHNSVLKYTFICILLGSVLFLLLFIMKKDRKYQNVINFINEKEACLIVDNNMVDKVINGKKLELDKVMYDYNVLRVEEDTVYLVYIEFQLDELLINTNQYSIKLGEESLYEYIVRIMKGV